MGKKLKLKKPKIKVSKYRNLKIGGKYGLILTIVLLLFAISTGISSFFMDDVGDNIEALERRGERAIIIGEMASLTRAKGIRVLDYQREPSSVIINEYEDREASFIELTERISDRMDTPELQELFGQIVENDIELNEIFDELVATVNSSDANQANKFVFRANQKRSETVELLNELQQLVNDERTAAVTAAKESQGFTQLIQLVSFVIAAAIGIALVILVSRMISRNLNKVVEVSNKIADGDLAVEKIDYNGEDEIGMLGESVNRMSENLRNVIQQVSEVSETVTSQSEELTQSANEVKAGTEQVATTMQELATGSETQANSASELSSVMSSFATKVQEANEEGDEAHKQSANVLEMTNEGSQLMKSSTQQMAKIDQIVQEAVQKVKGLDEQSKQISDLVTVIKDVAEQTNLLALNAAIEAARAGEHGKGFAVVADEVRKLAEQVSVSVTDITGIVTSIQSETSNVTESLMAGYKEVEQGSSQIDTTGQTFEKITNAVNRMATSINSVANNMSEIAASSQQMSSSIEEIAAISEESAAGVEQTSASTQQTTSTMEEVAGSSEQLAKLAEQLNGLVRQFKL
ncbi:methyl-accepting chemotaxis protein [Oceanobacillus limi]|uniref:Methyl-accepting chemotaxis protein n=1 Tax=Oceanobacillus limi TaxID=930131 RepID=A0A1I0BMD7_9BACI|nr:HAMP domain-containing methyl-accepting chemotaxis protein [Oceanobacillus limi]SET08024.1 methyl-accepting chemotaxis protein [Oceanobacillus limi]